MTLRSNDQFNTTVYGYDDRLRDVSWHPGYRFHESGRHCAVGLADGEAIGLSTQADDGIAREKQGLRVFAYDIPQGCLGAYYPECNVLIPLSHYAEESKVPAGKSVPVRIMRT